MSSDEHGQPRTSTGQAREHKPRTGSTEGLHCERAHPRKARRAKLSRTPNPRKCRCSRLKTLAAASTPATVADWRPEHPSPHGPILPLLSARMPKCANASCRQDSAWTKVTHSRSSARRRTASPSSRAFKPKNMTCSRSTVDDTVAHQRGIGNGERDDEPRLLVYSPYSGCSPSPFYSICCLRGVVLCRPPHSSLTVSLSACSPCRSRPLPYSPISAASASKCAERLVGAFPVVLLYFPSACAPLTSRTG